MAGGDLRKALARDITENGAGASRGLGWYGCGRHILVGVASGLTYLHSQQVGVIFLQQCMVQQCMWSLLKARGMLERSLAGLALPLQSLQKLLCKILTFVHPWVGGAHGHQAGQHPAAQQPGGQNCRHGDQPVPGGWLSANYNLARCRSSFISFSSIARYVS